MHTKTEQYKGFNIEIVSYDGLATVSFRFFVKADGFKAEGYATLNTAKRAITKHIASLPVKVVDESTGTVVAGFGSVPAAENYIGNTLAGVDAAGVEAGKYGIDAPETLVNPPVGVSVQESLPAGYTHPAPHWPYAGTGSEFTGERTPQGHKIATDPAQAKVYAEMDYYGVKYDARSRNKREGHFAGQEDGRRVRGEKTGKSLFSCTTGYYAPTRKHRKKAHMEVLNSTRQGAFGGVIKDFQF